MRIESLQDEVQEMKVRREDTKKRLDDVEVVLRVMKELAETKQKQALEKLT